jgi:hypothetical protein
MIWTQLAILLAVIFLPRQVMAASFAVIAAVVYQWANLGGLL